MTPPERAAYLIKELGYEKAEQHAIWVSNQAEKKVTREHWSEVADLIRQAQYKAYDETLSRTCASCSTPIPEGTGYCSDCKP